MIFLYFLSFTSAQYYDTEYDYYNMTYDNYAYLNDSLDYDPYDTNYNPAYYDIYFDENSTNVSNDTEIEDQSDEIAETTEGRSDIWKNIKRKSKIKVRILTWN